MRFTDLKDDALKCANYYPEDAKEKIDAVTDPETGRCGVTITRLS